MIGKKQAAAPPDNDILISFGRYLACGKTISLRDDILASLGPYRRRRNTMETVAPSAGAKARFKMIPLITGLNT